MNVQTWPHDDAGIACWDELVAHCGHEQIMVHSVAVRFGCIWPPSCWAHFSTSVRELSLSR
jgi:hypothetical protein